MPKKKKKTMTLIQSLCESAEIIKVSRELQRERVDDKGDMKN